MSVLALLLSLAACGGDNLTLPSEGEPAEIVIHEGNDQEGRVGEELEQDVVALVTDTRDRPVAGASVEFALNGGTARPTTAVSDADGLARTRITLGRQVGEVTGEARVPVSEGQPPIAAAFTATAHSDDAHEIAIFDGDNQNGAVGTQLAFPLVVQVTDGFDNPIPNITVNWSVTGGGTVSQPTTQTNEQGLTSVLRTLGSSAGPQTTVASADVQVGSPVTFNHVATAGNAARIVIVSGNNQEAAPGSPLPNPLVVELLDAENNPIVGRAVAWVVGTGGGSVAPETSSTDDQGRASTRWTLGPNPGPNTLSAVVSDVGRADFTATTSRVATSTSIVGHTPEPSLVGQPVEVRVQVSGSGGTPTGTVSVTAENASACEITLTNGTGACSLTFSDDGNQRITATYNGDARFAASSEDENHRVERAPNFPPVANADQYTTDEEVPLTVPAPGVLANDADLEGDQLRAVKDSDPSSGTLTLNQDGSFTYTPHPNFSGNDSFTYHASDGTGVSAPVTVTITVAPVNDAPAAQNDGPYLTPGGGQQLFVDPSTGVLANDSDAEANAMTAQLVGQASQGTVALNPDGSFSYTPTGAPGTTDAFTYTVSDGLATSGTATVSITIQ
jgi:VCBS repeat-containing protein